MSWAPWTNSSTHSPHEHKVKSNMQLGSRFLQGVSDCVNANSFTQICYFFPLRIFCVSRSLGFTRSHCSCTHKEKKLSQRAPCDYVWLAFTGSNFLNLFVDHRGPWVCAEPCTHSRFSYEKVQNNKKTCISLKYIFTRAQQCHFPFDG